MIIHLKDIANISEWAFYSKESYVFDKDSGQLESCGSDDCEASPPHSVVIYDVLYDDEGLPYIESEGYIYRG